MNDSAYKIMLIFPYQMKEEVAFVVLAIKHLVKTKQNICHFIIMTDISRHPNEKQTM